MVSVSRQTICAVELECCDPSIWLAFDIAQLFDMKILFPQAIVNEMRTFIQELSEMYKDRKLQVQVGHVHGRTS